MTHQAADVQPTAACHKQASLGDLSTHKVKSLRHQLGISAKNRAHITDDEGLSAEAVADVTILNVAPQIHNLTVTSMIDENGTVTLSGDIVDPERGGILVGARDPADPTRFLDTEEHIIRTQHIDTRFFGRDTTLCAVATNAKFSRATGNCLERSEQWT